MDVTEILVNCYEDPDFVHAAMQKTVPFLIDYINAYRSTGVMGVLMAEPLTGVFRAICPADCAGCAGR